MIKNLCLVLCALLTVVIVIKLYAHTKARSLDFTKYSLDGTTILSRKTEVEARLGKGYLVPEPSHPENDGTLLFSYVNGTKVRYSSKGIVDSIEGSTLFLDSKILIKRGQTKASVLNSIGPGMAQVIEYDEREFVSYGLFYVWFRKNNVDSIKLFDNSCKSLDFSGYE